ncbi:MAG TPA: rhomboid family intramembrane serine protease [Vicinamibacterales bacterium]
MRRPTAPSTVAYSFGPGPLTPAVKLLIIVNVAAFVAEWVFTRTAGIPLSGFFGLRPVAVLQGLQVWQVVTYMFLHGGVFHILFNMLALWMFGVELERMWGSRYFTKFYFITGIGAGIVHILASLTPFGASAYVIPTVGASGAIYGVLLAYAVYFPNRPIYMYFVFPIPAKYFVIIIGAIAFLAAADGSGSGVAHTAHLGGLLVAYLYLKKGPRVHLLSEIKYKYLKWRINRMRRRFDVYSGGRADDVDRRVH